MQGHPRIAARLGRQGVLLLIGFLLWISCSTTTLAFVLPPSNTNNPQTSTTTSLGARTPEISEWKVLRSGAVSGVCKFHPVIPNGDDITTSPLANAALAKAGATVQTASGSKYKLVGPSVVEKQQQAAKKAVVAAAKPAKSVNKGLKVNGLAGTPPKKAGGGFFGGLGVPKTASAPPPSKPQAKAKPATPAPVKAKATTEGPSKLSQIGQELMSQQVNAKDSGITLGDGAYVLIGSSSRSTSGKSTIWKCYTGNNKKNPLVAKVSANFDALSRENMNYQTIAEGPLGFTGAFCQRKAFLEYCDANQQGFETQSALILQSGLLDLKDLLRRNGLQGLPARALRDAGAAAAQCLQAAHSKGYVWTDCKTENFVVTDFLPNDGLTVKGIDLESAQLNGGNPSDFSPEACPPEFADAYLSGYGPDFILDPSYDMWSFGMLMYELSTGKPYFFKKSGTIITTTLRKDDFEADVSAIEDPKLQSLVGQCLQKDPRKRPSITTLLLHPYFTTTGIGAWTF